MEKLKGGFRYARRCVGRCGMASVKIQGAPIRFASYREARDIISTSDSYSKALSPFELQAKVQRVGELTEDHYLENCKSFVRPWAWDETAYLTEIARRTDELMSNLGIDVSLPPDITIVKTTGWEEGGANGYTRGNTIFLNQNSLSRDLFRHELFHIISRFDTEVRDGAYLTVGFERKAPIAFSDPNRISNPDAPSLEHTVRVTYRGQEVEAAIVLLSDRPYSGGSFFPYVRKRLLIVTPPPSSTAWPVLVEFSDVMGLYPKLGRNTAYNIHQEEICASHFELLLAGKRDLPNPEQIDALSKVLTSP